MPSQCQGKAPIVHLGLIKIYTLFLTCTDNSNNVIFLHLQTQSREYAMNEKDRSLVKATWRIAKKNGNIAPKAFIRYFKVKPEAQKQFAAFANVDLADLPTNSHFLNQVYTCLAGLNAYIENLGKNPKQCPHLNSPAFKAVKPDELKLFGEVMFTVMEEELGQSFSSEARKSWKDGLTACDIAFRKSHSS